MGLRIINNNQGGSAKILKITPNINGGIWLGFCLLDRYPGAAVAYSLRRLRIQYIGPLIRVRRSSDNAEMDIGLNFSSDGSSLDENALLAFVGNGNGFVTRWYDQSGNGIDQIRTIASEQPQIVTNGTIYRDNGKPALWFNGTNILRSATTTQIGSPTEGWSAVGVYRATQFGIARLFFSSDLPSLRIAQILRLNNVLGTFGTLAFNTIGGFTTEQGTSLNTNQNIHFANRTTTLLELIVNGQTNGPSAVTGTPQSSPTAEIGIGESWQPGAYPIGYIQELIFYNFHRTSTYQNMIREINSYYKIY